MLSRTRLHPLSFGPLAPLFACLLTLIAPLPAQAADRFVVLSYHDVQDAITPNQTQGDTVVTVANLRGHFTWLKDHGYHPVSVQDIFDAQAGRRKGLPDKAVLLTFDDGYVSFFDKVFPLLREFGYPAVAAVVTSWLDVPTGAKVPYSESEPWPREAFMSWPQLKTLARSGLVEIASHSHDMHRGLLGNPQGNLQPAAVTRVYDAKAGAYEADPAYLRRIKTDLRTSASDIFSHTGVHPRVMVWPYGEFSQATVAAAAEAGMTMTLGLIDGENSLRELGSTKRMLIAENPDVAQFANIVETLRADRPIRLAHVDLDYIHDPDPARTEQNLGAELDRLRKLNVNTVYLQAFADPDGDGNADALYFPNRHLPVRADLFNRAAWQMRKRAGLKVYAWLPVLAFNVKVPEDWYVQEWRDGKPQRASHVYRRLSPFHAGARQVIGEIYEDLAKNASFAGLLFHDDAILSDFEDVSPAALRELKKTPALNLPVDGLRQTAERRLAWARHKTAALNALTDELSQRVRAIRPEIRTARNMYALPILEPDSEEWFAQSLPALLEHYDYVAVEAMPLMEKAEKPDDWLVDLVKRVAEQPNGLKKTVFELQAVDWNTQQDIPMDLFLKQIRLIQEHGAVHFGYYPDNVYHDQPRQAAVQAAFNLPDLP